MARPRQCQSALNCWVCIRERSKTNPGILASLTVTALVTCIGLCPSWLHELRSSNTLWVRTDTVCIVTRLHHSLRRCGLHHVQRHQPAWDLPDQEVGGCTEEGTARSATDNAQKVHQPTSALQADCSEARPARQEAPRRTRGQSHRRGSVSSQWTPCIPPPCRLSRQMGTPCPTPRPSAMISRCTATP